MAASLVCKVEGCDKGGKLRRGWCNIHYIRWRNTGDPLKAAGTPKGEASAYMLDHMWDDCPKWPYYRDRKGYGRVNQSGRRAIAVHRVVCEMVNGPPPSPTHQAAHSCGKGHEGCFGAKCLSWKSPAENSADTIAHGTVFRSLTEVQAREIIGVDAASRTRQTAAALAQGFGVCPDTVQNVWRGKTWRWLSEAALT